MLIDHHCRLGSAVAICAVEIEGGNAMLAARALECRAAIQLLGCVVSYLPILVLLALPVSGNGCATIG